MATQAEIGKHLFLATRNVAELISRGTLKTGASLDDSREAYIRHLRDRAARWEEAKTGDEETSELEREKTRLTKAQADEKELQVKALQGTLVSSEEVEREWSSMISAARARLLSLPSKAASQVLAANGRIEVEEILRTMVNEALADLAQGGEDESDKSPEAEDVQGLDAAAPPDDKPVGKRKSPAQRGGQQRTRTVQQRPSPVPSGDDGRGKRSPRPRGGVQDKRPDR